MLESFIKDIIIEDVLPQIDNKQHGGRKGIGTDNMVVTLMDRVLVLIDDNNTVSCFNGRC